MKLNVLHLISGLGQGGAEQVLLDISIKFKKNRYIKSSVISFSDEITLLPMFKKNNIDISVLYTKKSLLDFIKTVHKVSLYIEKNEINIIHAHMSHTMIIAAILKMRFPKIKVIFTAHNVSLGSRFREGIIFLLKPFRSIDVLFSRDMHRWFNKYKYKTIPNGIIVENFEIETEKFEKFTFIAVGNIKKAKNYPFLIDCSKELSEKFDFQLFIVGSGENKIQLEEQVQELKLEKYVHILGYKNNIAQLLNQSHCLVMPSLWEGMPIVMLEAGASKLPIISTRVGSIPDILDDTCAYLSDLDDFSKNMAHVIANYKEAKIKAEKFNKKVKEKYTIDKAVESLEDLYKNLVK